MSKCPAICCLFAIHEDPVLGACGAGGIIVSTDGWQVSRAEAIKGVGGAVRWRIVALSHIVPGDNLVNQILSRDYLVCGSAGTRQQQQVCWHCHQVVMRLEEPSGNLRDNLNKSIMDPSWSMILWVNVVHLNECLCTLGSLLLLCLTTQKSAC